MKIRLTRVISFKTMKDDFNEVFIGITFQNPAVCANNIAQIIGKTNLHMEVYENKILLSASNAHINYDSACGIFLVLD